MNKKQSKKYLFIILGGGWLVIAIIYNFDNSKKEVKTDFSEPVTQSIPDPIIKKNSIVHASLPGEFSVENFDPIEKAAFEIQVAADKKHGVFESNEKTWRKYDRAMKDIPFSEGWSPNNDASFISILLLNAKSKEEAIAWSTQLARHRFAEGEDKLELVSTLIKKSISDKLMDETKDLIDCETGKMHYDFSNTEPRDVYLAFHPAIKKGNLNEPDFFQDFAYDNEDGNSKIRTFYSETIKLAKSKNPEMKTINGLLYLWSSHGSSINGELDIPLVQACNVTLNL